MDRTDVAALIHLLGGATADLSARGFWHGARRRENDFIRRRAGRIGHDLVRTGLQCRTGDRVSFARFNQYDDPLGSRRAIGDAENGHAALVHAGNTGNCLLDLLRIKVPAGANDDVLDTASDEDVATRHVAAIPGIPPIAVEQFASFRFVAEIAVRGRRTAKFDPSFPALAEFAACFVHHTDFVPGKGLPAGRKFQRPQIIRSGRRGGAMQAELVAIDPVDERLSP
jgi:hypothetical protein